jgi:hypothetical protein
MTAALTASVSPPGSIVDLTSPSREERSPKPVFPSYFAVPRDFFATLCDERVTASRDAFFPRPNEFDPQSPNVAVV